jgi:outer membrane protein assembly factor BamE (lipoprotein component of BamABCDE complex)
VIASTRLKRKLAMGVLIVAVGAAACAPIVRRHGYVPESAPLTDIKVGEDSKSSVLATYGNPSTTALFESDTWYYITNVQERLGFMKPHVSARSVTAISFDEGGNVIRTAEFNLEDGKVVDLVSRETPTRGRELSILEQLLGNVGRLPTEQFDQENLPGGAGGPRRQ